MPQSNYVVVDARPSRESSYFATFRRYNFWRLFVRNNSQTQGGVAGKGHIVPTFIPDLLAGGAAHEDPTGTGLFTTTTATTAVAMLANIICYFPLNGVGFTIPIQTINARIVIGMANQNSGAAYLATITLELIKVNTSGTITQLATQTLSPGSLVNTANASFSGFANSFSLTISSPQTISASERLAVRINTTGYSSSASYTAVHALNVTGGSSQGVTSSWTTGGNGLTSDISMEIY